jgi:uncharacterized RDD family membrane protein YckC
MMGDQPASSEPTEPAPAPEPAAPATSQTATPPAFPTESAAASVPSALAPWGTRAAGYLIDIAPFLILGLFSFRSFTLQTLIGVAGLAYTAYMGHLDGTTGQTPGKAIMGTRVVNTQGELIGSGSGIGRKFLHILDSLVCGLGYLLPLVDTKRQTIADKVMTTFVVTGVEKQPFSVNLWMPSKN